MDYNPRKNFILKAESVKVIEPEFSSLLGASSCCCRDRNDCLSLLVSHGDCVSRLPDGAVRIGTSSSCENELFLVGKKLNLLGCQSHPEFDLQYCILDRIWPAVVENKNRLSDDEVREARLSFESFRDDDSMFLRILIADFLHREEGGNNNNDECS